MIFLYKLSVHTKDVDDLGLVFHARYIEWLSVAREELLREVGITIKHMRIMGFRLVIKKIDINFKMAAKNEEAIIIETSIKYLLRHKITFVQTILSASGKILTTATVVTALIDDLRENYIIMNPQTYELFERCAP
jgi:acyl-CoA thioester hydrolase